MGVKFFTKNKIDLSLSNVTMAVTDAVATNDGAAFLNFVRNRDNTSGWMTTGSTDAAGTIIECDYTTSQNIDRMIFVKSNFKNYHAQYYDNNTLTWTDFSPAINVTNNTEETNEHVFTSVDANRFRTTISATQVVNDDKILRQWILCEAIGEMAVEPEMAPQFDKNRKVTRFLSGRSYIAKTLQSFAIKLKMNNVTADADLQLAEDLFNSFYPFLVWPCGGTQTQYDTIRMGYRMEDIFLMSPSNEYEPEWEESRYANGMPIKLNLLEVS